MCSRAPGATPRSVPAGGGAGAGDRRGDVRAVAVVVLDVSSLGHEAVALAATWPARSGCVGSTPVSSTATSTPAPVLPLGPDLGRADLRGGLGEVGGDLAVQPDLRDAAGERGASPARRWSAPRQRAVGQRGPERRRPRRGPARRRRRARWAARGRRRRRRAAPCRATGPRRRCTATISGSVSVLRVVVAVGEELGDVEQAVVERAGRDVGQRGVRVDVRAAVALGAVVGRRRPAGAGDRRDGACRPPPW